MNRILLSNVQHVNRYPSRPAPTNTHLNNSSPKPYPPPARCPSLAFPPLYSAFRQTSKTSSPKFFQRPEIAGESQQSDWKLSRRRRKSGGDWEIRQEDGVRGSRRDGGEVAKEAEQQSEYQVRPWETMFHSNLC